MADLSPQDKQRLKHIQKWFDLTLSDYENILSYQNGVCAICKCPPKKTRLHIDHDHKSGLVRGLLCPMCNRAIARFKDDLQRFKNAVVYFENPPVTQVLGEPHYGLKGRVSNKAKTVRRLNDGRSDASK